MKVTPKWIGSVAVLAVFVVLCGVQAIAAEGPKKGPLKVFILAGDSNCEGKAATKLLDYLINDPATAATYKHLKAADGKWAVREDVWIRYLGRKGNLTVGYGCAESQFGIELQFGNVIGNHLQNQALLIKTAWGGSGLSRNFGSPSSGVKAGECYTQMVDNVKDTLKNLKTLFPGYDEAAGYEIAGFVWFSGWNDAGMKDYEEKLANLIKDVRKDLSAPNMPVIIGELGVGGPTPPGTPETGVRKDQMAVAARPEFKGTVRYVKTAEYFDMRAMQMFRDGTWKGANKEEFAKLASDRPYHFMGSAKTFFLMGNAIGEGMVELLKKQ
ncbi:MAG: sialate O-acetylesterase [Planctomycetota bacterium]|nr:sialate O-acetylesterase [Planctomycetota bacterium]